MGIGGDQFIELADYQRYDEEEMVTRSAWFLEEMQRRRTVREFSDELVPGQVIENCLRAAGTAPSGANLQPWQFVVVTNPDLKRAIRKGAELEEYEFYHHRAPQEWLDALAPLGTDHHKPFLETAPILIAIFSKPAEELADGRTRKNYYAAESTGIATGLLIAALHHSGLATLTHTPSPMGFLNQLLGRPKTERPFLLLVVGYPASGVRVPNITRKTLDEIVTFKP
ncbi:MAG TPA: nitroreductase family protein [Pirellulaceae bacterium]|nr:nitroreductase family protein [Pirellulaceae bacterium]